MAVALAAIPFAWEAVACGLPTQYLYQGGDQAAIELATRRAVAFTQLVGPYDRFGWNHPGPVYLYLLSIPYRLFGPGARPELVGEVLIGGLAVVGAVTVVYRRAGGGAALWSCAWLLFFCWTLSALRLRFPWNPLAVVLPMVLLVVLVAAAIDGSGLSLLGAVLVGTFVVQTDVSTLPLTVVVLAVGAACLLARWARQRQGEARDRGGGRAPRALAWGAVGVAVLIGAWIGPLLQEANGPGPGNLGTILHFFTHSSPHVSWYTATHAVAAVDSLLPYGASTVLGQTISSPAPWLILALAVLVAAAATGLGLWRKQWMSLGLGALSLVGIVGSIAAVTRIVGGLIGYLVLWEIAFPLAGLIGLGVALLGTARTPGRSFNRLASLTRRAGVALAGCATTAVTVGLLLQVTSMDYPPGSLNGSEVALAWRMVGSHLPPPPGTVLVEMGSANSPQFFLGAGLVDRLASLGYRARVPADWRVQFGRSQVLHSRPDNIIALRKPGSPPPAGFVLLGDASAGSAVYISAPPNKR